MSKKYLLLCTLPFIIATSNAKSSVDCRVVTGAISSCNPYASKFIVAKEIQYKEHKNKLIINKTLPMPEKEKVKVITVLDMIEKYISIEEPLRYEGYENSSLSLEDEMNLRRQSTIDRIRNFEKESYNKMISEQHALMKIYDAYKEDNNTVDKLIEEKASGIYEVSSGDSLSRIAHRFYMKTNKLMKINNISKGDKLKIGKKLKIHLEQEKIDIISKAEYVIESGDNIGSLSEEFNITKSDILKYNKLKNSSKLKIGQKIILPFPYKIAQLERKRKALIAQLKRDKAIRGNLKRRLRVTATAYTSHAAQTDSTPFLAAWNNRIRPGMKIIAVSRDMLTRYGLRNGSKVRIAGLTGYYTVRDKMNKRYRKRIDIYMGMNRRRALRWGRRSVIMYY